MIEILIAVWRNPVARNFAITGILILAIGVTFAVLSRRADRAAEKLRIEKLERERLERENEGLKILSNSANTAREVEKLNEVLKDAKDNSNIAINSARDSRARDSREFSDNDADVWRRFCATFPTDSRCR